MAAMSGGVDSSVAAALLLEAGHDVSGVTMKLWGGESDRGCCSVSDVDDARRVAQQLDIDFHVFNFGDDFTAHVVDPYVAAWRDGTTPNPCIECNRHLKFDRLLRRADALGFDAVATGHHARIVELADGTRRVARGADEAKDQSYVLYMLDQGALRRTALPIGAMTKDDVRAHARRLGLRTADKPDSQDVCFITATGGRRAFLGPRIPLKPATLRTVDGDEVGRVDAVELVTIGQRKGLGLGGRAEPMYVVDIDRPAAAVTVGPLDALLRDETDVADLVWAHGSVEGDLEVQCSAHGEVAGARVTLVGDPGPGRAVVRWHTPRPRVAPGQSVVFYDGDHVVGGGIAT
jgi:tRNA-specific 2-thiouridylase